MEFLIKIMDPVNSLNFDSEDESISSAIETIYEPGLNVQIFWRGIPIGISMKWDVSDIWNDLREMLQHLNTSTMNRWVVGFPSSSFMATWEMERIGDHLSIQAFWTTVIGGKMKLNELSKAGNKIEVSVKEFVKEWHKILIAVKFDLIKAGYSSISLRDFNFLDDELGPFPFDSPLPQV